MQTVTDHDIIRAHLLRDVEAFDRAYAGRAEPADPWTRVGRHAYELDEPLALKSEPERAARMPNYDPEAPDCDHEEDRDPATLTQYARVDSLIAMAEGLNVFEDWTGYPSEVHARDKARRLRRAAERMTGAAGSIEAQAAAARRRQYGKVRR